MTKQRKVRAYHSNSKSWLNSNIAIGIGSLYENTTGCYSHPIGYKDSSEWGTLPLKDKIEIKDSGSFLPNPNCPSEKIELKKKLMKKKSKKKVVIIDGLKITIKGNKTIIKRNDVIIKASSLKSKVLFGENSAITINGKDINEAIDKSKTINRNEKIN